MLPDIYYMKYVLIVLKSTRVFLFEFPQIINIDIFFQSKIFYLPWGSFKVTQKIWGQINSAVLTLRSTGRYVFDREYEAQ